MPFNENSPVRQRRRIQIARVSEDASGEEKDVHIRLPRGLKGPILKQGLAQLSTMTTLPKPMEKRVRFSAHITLEVTFVAQGKSAFREVDAEPPCANRSQ